MFQLQIGSHSFSTLQDFQSPSVEIPHFAKDAFSFCKDWLEGKNSYLLHTSGSTGTPKPILIQRSQMESSALATKQFFEIPAKPQLLCCMNTQFIAGKMMLVRAMVWGGSILLVEPSSTPLKNLPDSFDPEFVAMVPLQLEESIKNSLHKLKAINYLLIGGAPASKNLQEAILELKLNAFQSYGMTETVSHIAIASYSSEEMVYQVLPSVEVGTDNRGALWVNCPMSNHQKIQTNDMVELIDPYHFKWLGRTDFVINSGGYKLHPERIEKKLEHLIPDHSYFLFGIPDSKFGQKLVLIIESDLPVADKVSQELKDKFLEVLDKYEIPKEIYFVDKFIRTETGKINRKLTADNI